MPVVSCNRKKMRDQPYITKDIGGHWRTVYSENAEAFSDSFYEGLELMETDPKKAEKIFKQIITVCGNGHIDAILHLGFLYNETNKKIEGNALIHKAHNIALQAIPKDFDSTKERIEWGHIDNRPFLRTFHAIGLEYMEEEQYDKAIEKFNFILNVNPNDNQGVRFLVEDCNQKLKK